METLKTAVSEQETPKCNDNITNGQVKLLTMGREWTTEERLKYIAYRDMQWDYVVSKSKKVNKWYTKKRNPYKKENTTKEVKRKPKKSSGRVKLWDWVKTDTEHLNAKSRWWSNSIEFNLQESRSKVDHILKHQYFWNKLLHEQLKQVMWDNYKVMHRETRDIIVNAINHILWYFIKKWKFYDERWFRNPKYIPKTL